MQSFVGVFICSTSELSGCILAWSLGIFAILVIRLVGVHHGGLMHACISSMASVMYSGSSLTKYSRLDINVPFLFMVQYLFDPCRHVFIGWFRGRVWMRVRYFVICLRSSRSIGSSCVLCWRASVDVVRKHPVVV